MNALGLEEFESGFIEGLGGGFLIRWLDVGWLQLELYRRMTPGIRRSDRLWGIENDDRTSQLPPVAIEVGLRCGRDADDRPLRLAIGGGSPPGRSHCNPASNGREDARFGRSSGPRMRDRPPLLMYVHQPVFSKLLFSPVAGSALLCRSGQPWTDAIGR